MNGPAYRFLADAVVLLHVGFILFVVAGALAVARWRRLAPLHLLAVAWGIAVEAAGWHCPLTGIEIRLRLLAGQAGYGGGFIEHYLLALIYPAGLTRAMQWGLGAGVLAVNLALYVRLVSRPRRRC